LEQTLILRVSRRSFAAGGAAFAALAGTAHAASLTAEDVTIGTANARLHLVEYASLTCPHCAEFHAAAWSTLQSRYIETGRVRFTFREMATAPPAVALAMFQLARCETTAPGEYLRRVSILFAQQRAILGTGTMAGVRDSLFAIGGQWGLSAEQIMACFNDEAGPTRITRSMEQANALGITSTPSFLVNGQRVTDPAFHTLAGMTATLDARLAG
jgi:protein-disulfide isomerase